VPCPPFANLTATTATYPLSLHDALPICECAHRRAGSAPPRHDHAPEAPEPHLAGPDRRRTRATAPAARERPHGGRAVDRLSARRSEEHTSELQSRENLVCRLLLEKKKQP